MKWLKADLIDDVVSVYDQTKTTTQGRIVQKTVDSTTVLGPPLTRYYDFFTNLALTPTHVFCSDNGHLFVVVAPTNGTTYDSLPIFLFDFDFDNGNVSYVGRINVELPNLAATTHTIRGLKVIDAGLTDWRIVITTTASILINGGLFLVNKVDKSDFSIGSPPTIPMATSTDATAVYLLQDPSNIGVNQLNVASTGLILDIPNEMAYVHNGVAATHQFYVYNLSITPTYTTSAVSVSVASPGVVTHAAHTFNNNDPVIFTAGTLPTGLVVGTVYFVRNSTAGVSYELSATSGGASINTTGSPSSGATIGRAWGTIDGNFLHKTGNLTALSGVLLLNNSEYLATPISAPLNGGVLNGNDCAFFSTSTTLYLGLLSELTSGATSWPSLTSSNLLGSTNQFTAVTNLVASWSNVLDSATFVTNSSIFITKQVENNAIDLTFGCLDNSYFEGTALPTVNFSSAIFVSIDHSNGWLFGIPNTTGQRVLMFMDMRSDVFYDYSYIVTKVLDNENAKLRFISSYEEMVEKTGNIKVAYRDSGFGSITGGWIDINSAEDLESLIISSNEIQFKIHFSTLSEMKTQHAQINELLIGTDPNNAISDNWEFSDDFSDNTSPSRCAFRLKRAYTSLVPTLYFRAYDLSDALLVNHNTVTNVANFEYSTDNGLIWNPLGTITNAVGTLVRYTFTSPPGVDIRPGLKES